MEKVYKESKLTEFNNLPVEVYWMRKKNCNYVKWKLWNW